MAGRHDDRFSNIVLAPPVSLAAAAWMIAAVLAFCFLAAFRVQYTRKLPLQGWLLPDAGLLQVYSPQSGTITRSSVHQGSRVKKGDQLFVVSAERTSAQLGLMGPLVRQRIQERLESLDRERNQLLRLQQESKTGLDRHLQRLEADLAGAQKERDLAQKRLDIARADFGRAEALRRENLISATELEQKQAASMAQESALLAAERNISGLKDEVNRSRSDYQNQESERATRLEAISREVSSIREQRDDRDLTGSLAITAPVDATVSSELATPGAAVNTSSPVLVLLPENAPLQIHALVSGESSGLLKPGQAVALQYRREQSRPVMSRISWISPAPLSEVEISSKFGIRHQGPAYELVVALPEEMTRSMPEYVPRPGAELELKVYVERKNLAMWVLGRLLPAHNADVHP
jgi:membrane fusion protein